jgi:hypothetical protein
MAYLRFSPKFPNTLKHGASSFAHQIAALKTHLLGMHKHYTHIPHRRPKSRNLPRQLKNAETRNVDFRAKLQDGEEGVGRAWETEGHRGGDDSEQHSLRALSCTTEIMAIPLGSIFVQLCASVCFGKRNYVSLYQALKSFMSVQTPADLPVKPRGSYKAETVY